MDLSLRIDKVEHIGTKRFLKEYLEPQRPLVIKGLAKNTYAGKKWSINYFRQTMGHEVIDLIDNRNADRACSANTGSDLSMRFGDYLDIISKNEHTDLRIFLFNMFKLNPKLQDEFPCPRIFKGMMDGVGHMFFGGRNTTVRMHYDIDMSNVLHTQFAGRKRVVLFGPGNNDVLYRLPMNTYSLVDPDKPDYKKYPALLLAKGYDFILEPGESLYMPSGYWHYMTYLEGGFSISYRKVAHSMPMKLRGLNNLCLAMPLDKLANKMLGKKWLEMKRTAASKKACRAIQKVYASYRSPAADENLAAAILGID